MSDDYLQRLGAEVYRTMGHGDEPVDAGDQRPVHGPPAFNVRGRCAWCKTHIYGGPSERLDDAEERFKAAFQEHAEVAHFAPDLHFHLVLDEGTDSE